MTAESSHAGQDFFNQPLIWANESPADPVASDDEIRAHHLLLEIAPNPEVDCALAVLNQMPPAAHLEYKSGSWR
jgi:hypothetical protein